MTTTNFPAKDLSLTNLVVQQTFVAKNAAIKLVNGNQQISIVQNIFDVFTGAKIGSWSFINNVLQFSLCGYINNSGSSLPANTTFAKLSNYGALQDVTFNAFIFDVLAGAGDIALITIDTSGNVTSNTTHTIKDLAAAIAQFAARYVEKPVQASPNPSSFFDIFAD